MTAGESVLLLLGSLSLGLVALGPLERRLSRVLLLVVLAAPAICLAVERGSQFTTADEKRILREILFWSAGSEAHDWRLGALRTTSALTGPIAAGAERFLPDRPLPQKLALLKQAHWLIGFLLYLWLCRVAHRALSMPLSVASWTLLNYSVLLLPVHLMALKIFNYDELSLLLSVLSLLFAIAFLRSEKGSDGYWSVALGYLAAQEKVSAGPFLLLALVLFAHVHLRRRISPRTVFLGLVGPLVLCLSVGALTSAIAWSTRGPGAPEIPRLWLGILDPMVSWIWVLERFLLSIKRLSAHPWQLLVLVAATTLGALVVGSFRRYLESGAGDRVSRRVVHLRALLLLALIVLGLWGTLHVAAFWHPMHPVPEGAYAPKGSINQITLHFEARSYPEHLFRGISFHSAVFLGSLPTALLTLSVILLVSRWRSGQGSRLMLELSSCAALAIPFVYACAQMPFGHRYMNFALLVLALLTSAELVRILHHKPRALAAVVAAVALSIMAELAPFAPAYFAFRPLWSSHDYPDRDQPILGMLNPTWMGWGEETMLGGRLLQSWLEEGRTSGKGSDDPVLYVWYFADWLDPDPGLEVLPLALHLEELRYTEDEYILINRTSFVQGNCAFPTGVEPEHVFAFRGYPQAWLYRGDRIASAGYSLQCK